MQPRHTYGRPFPWSRNETTLVLALSTAVSLALAQRAGVHGHDDAFGGRGFRVSSVVLDSHGWLHSLIGAVHEGKMG